MPNKEFHSTFAGICATIISIMMAFYGVLVINLGEQVQIYRERTVNSLQQVDASVESFSRITEPLYSSNFNWTIQMDIEWNIDHIFRRETWVDSPIEVLNTTVTYLLTNFTMAEKMDEAERDFLDQLNITRFSAHYVLPRMHLNRLISDIYREFPPPPGKYSYWEMQYFVNSSFPPFEERFPIWAERFNSYHSGISSIRSMIAPALQGISEAYLDSAKSKAHTVEQLIEQNETGYEWHIQTLQESIQHDTAMPTYYNSIFESISEINSGVLDVKMNSERYYRLRELAFSYIQVPILFMVVSGIVMPMLLLGLNSYIESHQKNWSWWSSGYPIIVIVSVLIFILFTIIGIGILWNQISELYLT